MSDLEDLVDVAGSSDDLFGDDDGGADSALEDRERILSDRELDSNDDEDANHHRREHYEDDLEEAPRSQGLVKQKVIMAKTLYRHRLPKPKDQTLRSLRVPKFLKFVPEEYRRDTWEASDWDIANARSDNAGEAVRFTQDPGTGKSRSNALMYRWSDGSVTLSVGSEHYELKSKSQAPAPNKPYQEIQDAHYYAATAELQSNLFLVVGHITEQFTVQPNKIVNDDALSTLATRMADAAQARQTDMIVKISGSDNPELVRKQIEAADREQLRAQRRRENAEHRIAAGMGRSSGRSGGLSIGDIEGRKPGGLGRKRGMPGAQRHKRRRPDYDTDDDLPQGARRLEEYDKEDDFIAPSDEEDGAEADDDEEILDDDDDDDEEEEEEEEEGGGEEEGGEEGGGGGEKEAPKSKRRKKAGSDADGESDHDLGRTENSRSRRRRVVDEDDE